MDEILNFFFNEGILGVMVAAQILVIVYLYKQLEKEREKRLDMVNAYVDKIDALQELRVQLQERHTENMMVTHREVDKMVTHLTNTLEALISALAKGIDDDRKQ